MLTWIFNTGPGAILISCHQSEGNSDWHLIRDGFLSVLSTIKSRARCWRHLNAFMDSIDVDVSCILSIPIQEWNLNLQISEVFPALFVTASTYVSHELVLTQEVDVRRSHFLLFLQAVSPIKLIMSTLNYTYLNWPANLTIFYFSYFFLLPSNHSNVLWIYYYFIYFKLFTVFNEAREV